MDHPKMNNDWDSILSTEFDKEYFIKMQDWLINEYNTKTIFPPIKDVYSALRFTSYKDTKVVILGQDPYHEKGQAHGFSFSVLKPTPQPPSLVNIFKELKNDLGIEPPNKNYGDLTYWAKQGVLLLNTTLTVEEHKANSHKDIGWSKFTDHIISELNKKPEPVVFILWGKNARDKKGMLNNPNHLVLESSHPSPFSASYGFFGSKPFSKTNNFLREKGCDPIDWEIRND